MMISLSTFQIATAVPASSQMGFSCKIVLFALFLQVFWNCFFGQLLISKSLITNGVYDCGWEKWENLALKKSILIVLMNDEKGAKVTTKFSNPVSMALFYDVSIDKISK